MPLDDFPATKRSYMLRDLHCIGRRTGASSSAGRRAFPCARWRRFRLAIAAGDDIAAVSQAIFRAYWVEGRDISDPAILRDFGDAEAIEKPAIKDQLRQNTDGAIAAGVCGVPSFQVREHLFWGQDRLDLVSRTLGGWDPPA